MQQEELAKVSERHQYIYDGGLLLKLLLLFIFIILGILAVQITVQYSQVPEPKYFPATANNQLIQPIALDQPHVTTNYLLNWVNQVVTRAFTFNYDNFELQLTEFKPYFTDSGFNSYLNALRTAGDLKYILDNKAILKITPLKTPEIISGRVYNGHYTWALTLSMQYNIYSGTQGGRRYIVDIIVYVTRVPTTETPEGIKILGLLLKRKGTVEAPNPLGTGGRGLFG